MVRLFSYVVVTRQLPLLVCTSVFLTATGYAQHAAWVVPDSAYKLVNPATGSESAIKDGHMTYAHQCAPCHGYKGLGDGPVSYSLNPKPANHSSKEVQDQPDGVIFWKITEGRGAMAPYKTTLTDQQRWNLVCYIRTLKKN